MLVVIGNAEPREDQSEFIDGCDTVIRFNRTPFFDTGKTGRKTTILCLFGIPYPIAGAIPQLHHGVVTTCETIWAETDLFAEPLARDYGVPQQKIECRTLNGIRDRFAVSNGIIRPSSGFQVLRYLVNSSTFADTEKFIRGFTFQGGRCHQWEAEKRQVEHYLQRGLIHEC